MKYLHLFSKSKNINNLENIINKENPFDQIKWSYRNIFICDSKLICFNEKFFYLDTNSIESFKIKEKDIFILGKHNKTLILGYNITFKKLKRIFNHHNISLNNIRECLAIAEKKMIPFISSLYSLSRWHTQNIFCSKCGSSNRNSDYGYSLVCKNKHCKNKIFPRIDPTVIMLIKYKNKILLARDKNWKKNLYSCLAGFCETSESLEEAVNRETYEEVGLEVQKIRYKFSQFWPFSNNLMIGFEATAKSDKLAINKLEIESAIWVTRLQVKKLQKSKELILPKKYAIAYCLINDWLKK